MSPDLTKTFTPNPLRITLGLREREMPIGNDIISIPIQRAPNSPNFAQPNFSRSKGTFQCPQRDGTNLGVIAPVWLVDHGLYRTQV